MREFISNKIQVARFLPKKNRVRNDAYFQAIRIKNQFEKIYILSGLGADERVFKYLDFKDWDVTFVNWIKPLPNEALADYTKRISDQIKHENPILIGLSFGGIIATELTKIIEVKKLILISSLKISGEIPTLYRLAGKLRLHRIIPYTILKKDHFLNRWLFGVVAKSDRDLFRKVLADTDIDYLKWAINTVVSWNNIQLHPNLFHIHGTNDKILPINKSGKVIPIQNGGHLMVLTKSKQVSETLHQII